MKNIVLLTILLVWTMTFANAQKIVKKINSSVTETGIEAKLRFLASDEMRGRDTGSPELDIAARYIAEAYREMGLKTAPSLDNYYQSVPLYKQSVAKDGSLIYGLKTAKNKEDILFLAGNDGDYEGEFIFANYGLEADYQNIDVSGKVVVVYAGSEEATSVRGFLGLTNQKRSLAEANGAKGIVELYKSTETPWKIVVNFMSRSRVGLSEEGTKESTIFAAWLADANGEWENAFKAGNAKAKFRIKGAVSAKIQSKNVVGWIEGKDPEKKNEYMIMTAHYDHVGVAYRGPEQDSIFNGARDNAIGVATLLETAKLFSQNRPAYSVVFVACTAEEKGLLGSRWYVENPLFPLEKTYFNFNTDGGGYNDTSIAAVIGLNRTGATADLKKSVEPFGLGIIDDPVPEQGLFDRSDNVNFARKGIPALTFSCGIRAFDEEILKYYHQTADEVDSMDMTYLTKYARSFVYAAYLLANTKEKPFWNAGDKYEEVGKELYGK